MKLFSAFSLRLWLPIVAISVLAGCNFGPVLPSTDKITSSKLEYPTFHMPQLNSKEYQERHWILLAESKEHHWLYDPYSLIEDEDNILIFDALIAPRQTPSQLKRFNATVIGPYRQKIDCFGNHQWSEIFYADGMPDQETFKNPKNPKLEYGWIKIKPKTAMAYIRSRLCGRKFLDSADINYFLYQEGKMTFPKAKNETVVKNKPPLTPGELMVAEYKKTISPKLTPEDVNPSEGGSALFYEVINNAVTIVDPKNDVREMRVSSYQLDKELPKLDDYVFRANCQAKTYSFFPLGKSAIFQELSDAPESLPNVAFNRLCGDHGNYMKFVSRKGQQ